MKSKKFRLNAREVLKGLLIAFFTGALTFISQNSFANFGDINWESIILAGGSPMAIYLLHTFFENDK